MSNPTITSINPITNLESVTAVMSDGSTAQLGSVTSAAANAFASNPAAVQKIHDALQAYVTGLQSQITTQTTAATTATAATATLQGQVDAIVAQGLAANGDPVKLGEVLTQAAALSTSSRLAAKQAAVDAAAAALAAAQAALAAHS